MSFSIAPKSFTPQLCYLFFLSYPSFLSGSQLLFFSSFQGWMAQKFGWMLTILINVYFFAIIFFASSKIGKIKLGAQALSLSFRHFLGLPCFLAGMGIGLLYFSVAEPMFHFNNPISTQFSINQK